MERLPVEFLSLPHHDSGQVIRLQLLIDLDPLRVGFRERADAELAFLLTPIRLHSWRPPCGLELQATHILCEILTPTKVIFFALTGPTSTT